MKNKSTVKWIYSNLKNFIGQISLVSVCNIILSLSLIYLADLSSKIIDSGKNLNNKAILIGIILLGQVILQLFSSVMTVKITGLITIKLRQKIFFDICGKEYAGIEKYHSGDFLNKMTNDVGQVAKGAVELIPETCTVLTKIIAGLYAIIKHNYLLAVIILAVGFLIPLLGRIFSKKYKYLHKEVVKTEGEARSFYQECIENLIVIKSFSASNSVSKKASDIMENNLELRIKQRIFSSVMGLSLFLSFSLGYYGVILWAVSAGVSYGTLYYLLQIITILRSPLQNVSGIIPKFYSMTASAERIMEISSIPDENSSENEISEEFQSLNCSDLSFSYKDNTVLKNSSFIIKKNTVTLLKGESGCGKTTLFKILLGLYSPTSGTLKVNSKYDIGAQTRKLFSYVPQGNMIISGTIKDNITFLNKDIPEEKIIGALKIAGIYDYISSLPKGIETVLKERGQGLSEGQIQRLAIARALIYDAPVLLLDESTSALDKETEQKILENIKNMTDKTVIFITHRKTETLKPDKILLFNNGTIEERNA